MGITNDGLAKITELIAAAFPYIALGSGNTAFSGTQTTLISELTSNGLGRKAATVTRLTTTRTNDTIQFYGSWTCTGGTNYVNEVGIFTSSSGGIMGSRDVTASTRTLQSGYTITETIQWIFG